VFHHLCSVFMVAVFSILAVSSVRAGEALMALAVGAALGIVVTCVAAEYAIWRKGKS
jgi:hypothetical protein